jgi:hypothetical protein
MSIEARTTSKMFTCGHPRCECEVDLEGEFCGPSSAAEDARKLPTFTVSAPYMEPCMEV